MVPWHESSLNNILIIVMKMKRPAIMGNEILSVKLAKQIPLSPSGSPILQLKASFAAVQQRSISIYLFYHHFILWKPNSLNFISFQDWNFSWTGWKLLHSLKENGFTTNKIHLTPHETNQEVFSCLRHLLCKYSKNYNIPRHNLLIFRGVLTLMTLNCSYAINHWDFHCFSIGCNCDIYLFSTFIMLLIYGSTSVFSSI